MSRDTRRKDIKKQRKKFKEERATEQRREGKYLKKQIKINRKRRKKWNRERKNERER